MNYEHRLFSKVHSGLLVNFIGRSFGLFVKIQWRHESCVEKQIKPSLEDQEDVE